jgi:hypothetical protein
LSFHACQLARVERGRPRSDGLPARRMPSHWSAERTRSVSRPRPHTNEPPNPSHLAGPGRFIAEIPPIFRPYMGPKGNSRGACGRACTRRARSSTTGGPASGCDILRSPVRGTSCPRNEAPSRTSTGRGRTTPRTPHSTLDAASALRVSRDAPLFSVNAWPALPERNGYKRVCLITFPMDTC